MKKQFKYFIIKNKVVWLSVGKGSMTFVNTKCIHPYLAEISECT